MNNKKRRSNAPSGEEKPVYERPWQSKDSKNQNAKNWRGKMKKQRKNNA